MTPDPVEEKQSGISWLRIWAEVAGAWAISVAYPIYNNIASGPEALTSYGVRRLDLLVLILVVSLLGPLLVSLVELLIRRLFGEKPRLVAHGIVIGVLVALALWQWLLDQGSAAALKAVLPLLLAALLAWLYVRTELVRNFALMLSFATIVVVVVFCLSYPIKDELFPHDGKTETAEIEPDTPVVLVIFDELPLAALERPDGTIDPRFPAFAELASKGTWYPGAVSVADQTTFALPSILTGQDPDPPGSSGPVPPGLPDYPDNICRIAADGGYEVHSYEPITDLCDRHWGLGTRVTAPIRRAVGADPPAPWINLAPGNLDKKVSQAIGAPFGLPWEAYGAERDDAFNWFIEEMPDQKRSLSVLHMTLPHIRWMYMPDGSTYENLRSDADDQLVSPATESEVERDAQQMMLQLSYTDRELGRLIQRMKEQGTWDESLFIVTADHGGAFQTSISRRLVNLFNAGWILPVPLFIKYPGQTSGELVQGTVDGRDIVPTILGQLGIDPPERIAGRDLSDRRRLPAKETTDMVSAVGGVADYEIETVSKLRRQASRYMSGLLGDSFFAPGGKAGLLGSRPDGFEEIPAEPSDPSLYENVDRESGEVNSYYQARLLPADGRINGPVAISLNGQVAATANPWQVGQDWFVGANLPSGDFRDGSNEIRVYEIGTSD